MCSLGDVSDLAALSPGITGGGHQADDLSNTERRWWSVPREQSRWDRARVIRDAERASREGDLKGPS